MFKKIGKTLIGLGLFWGSASMAIKMINMINGKGVERMEIDALIAYFVCIVTFGVIASLLIPDETASVFLVVLSGITITTITHKGPVSSFIAWAIYIGAIIVLRHLVMNIVWGKVNKAISGPKRFGS